jgi:hypothetical protein
MKGYPLFFKIDNARDKCDFCSGSGKLLKALASGKCICLACVEHISEAMCEDTLLLPAPMHQPTE